MSRKICADDETAVGTVTSPAIDPRGPEPAAPPPPVASPEGASSLEQPADPDSPPSRPRQLT